jgi:hypothetical protein
MDEAKPPQPAAGSAAAGGAPNAAPAANIETAPRRKVWREISWSDGRLRFVVMGRILAHGAPGNPLARPVF